MYMISFVSIPYVGNTIVSNYQHGTHVRATQKRESFFTSVTGAYKQYKPFMENVQ